MKWFQGNINEAVAASKTRKAIFVVFVEGKDDASSQVAGAINTEEVSSRLERDDFVAVRLESGSESYRFFAQIYQLVPIPSLFFIGENGAPLEIVAGNANTADLLSKIDSVLAKVGKSAKSSSADLLKSEQRASDLSFSKNPETELGSIELDVNKSGPSTASTPTISKMQEEGADAKDDDPMKETPSVPEALMKASDTSSAKLETSETSETSLDQKNQSDLSAEEKVERAKQLIELQKKQRLEEERIKERERELERRKLGRDMQKMKQAQQDLEIKQAHEERMREKAAEAAAKDKVRQQIAQDRLERKEKELALQQQQQSTQQQATQDTAKPRTPRTPLSNDSQVVRIQFRLPTGNPHMGQFQPESTLGVLRSYVVENIELPFRQFALSTSFPRRELTPEDDDKTLLELELVPTAVILILPLRNSTITTTVTSSQDVGFFSQIMWTVFAPIVSMYNYVMGYFSGPRPRPAGRTGGNVTGSGISSMMSNTERPNSPPVRAAAPPTGLLRRNIGGQGTTTIRAQGNVHRLHSGGDQDNDENNTWNGNSTQQM